MARSQQTVIVERNMVVNLRKASRLLHPHRVAKPLLRRRARRIHIPMRIRLRDLRSDRIVSEENLQDGPDARFLLSGFNLPLIVW